MKKTTPVVLLGAVLAHALSAGIVAAQEVWVVNETSRDVSILNGDAESIVGAVPLADLPQGPYGVAFSTLPGSVGEFAFVTQGPFIRVIDTASRLVVRTVNVGGLLGLPTALKGCSAARPREFLDTAARPVLVAYLHVAAQVQSSGVSDPWFIVLDQSVLISPPGPSPIVAAGSILGPRTGVTREAMDVFVLGTASGALFQRAWYTVRETAPNPTIFGALLATERELGSAWTSPRVIVEPMPSGTSAPDSVAVGAAFSRELPGLPLGPGGRLLNLDTGDSCDIGVIPRSVAVTGVGPRSFTVLVADKVGEMVPGMVHALDGQTCDVQSLPVGVDPVDIATLGPIRWQKAFVANRGSDSVTVIRPDGSQTTIVLDTMPGPCSKCPRSLAANVTRETACTVERLLLDKSADAEDVELSWTPVGCEQGTLFEVWCVCEAGADDCPAPCVPSEIRDLLECRFEGCPRPHIDGDWRPLGITPGTSFTHEGGGRRDSVSYDVEPNDE